MRECRPLHHYYKPAVNPRSARHFDTFPRMRYQDTTVVSWYLVPVSFSKVS